MVEPSQQTNAGLFHAQRIVAIASASSAQMNTANSVATGDSAASEFHGSLEYAAWQCLKTAWLSWLGEVNAFSSEANVSFESLKSGGQVNNPNMVHLINLNLEPSSWVSQLLRRVGEDGSVVLSTAAKSVASPVNALSLVDLDKQSELDVLTIVIAEFKQHVQSARAQQQEW